MIGQLVESRTMTAVCADHVLALAAQHAAGEPVLAVDRGTGEVRVAPADQARRHGLFVVLRRSHLTLGGVVHVDRLGDIEARAVAEACNIVLRELPGPSVPAAP